MREKPSKADAAHPQWRQALLAIDLIEIAGPSLGGIRLRARAGPVRDAWLEILRRRMEACGPWLRVAPPIQTESLLGGVDLAASLERGTLVRTPGMLARVDGGVLVLAMSERVEHATAALIGGTMDNETVTDQFGGRLSARFTLVALDEGAEADECLPRVLRERLALDVDLEGISIRDIADSPPNRQIRQARALPPGLPDELRNALCELAGAAGPCSTRLAIWLCRATCYCAALRRRNVPDEEDAALAVRLCMGLQPQAHAEEEESEAREEALSEPVDSEPASDAAQDEERPSRDSSAEAEGDSAESGELAELIIAAAAVSRHDLGNLPQFAAKANGASKSGGRIAGAMTRSRRGRPGGLVATPPTPGARPDVVATLRAAAPWQKLRARGNGMGRAGLMILPSDFRYMRYRDHGESTAIFAVDASGSTAMQRLGEAKGAIELLLGDCYVRRHHVAMVSFRGKHADILLEPTRSLVRAKRSLSGLPGGGGTPLADAIACSIKLAAQVKRGGASPLLVFLTDGRANIALDGTADRTKARHDAETVARQGAALGFRTLFIDISRRSRDAAREIADAMHADYRLLPNANATSVSGLVGSYLEER